KLPHHLIEAFKSTLEEARYSDIILHVVDASNPQMDMQMHIVYETLKQLEVTDKTMVTIFNKSDLQTEAVLQKDSMADYQLSMSAKTGEGSEQLKETLEAILRNRKVYLEKLYSYSEAGKIQLIRKYGELLSEEYGETGITVKAYVPSSVYGQLL
ncbi:MAG: GTPase HflX, partial [Hungatella sp.]